MIEVDEIQPLFSTCPGHFEALHFSGSPSVRPFLRSLGKSLAPSRLIALSSVAQMACASSEADIIEME